jgi:hypothetical protein
MQWLAEAADATVLSLIDAKPAARAASMPASAPEGRPAA